MQDMEPGVDGEEPGPDRLPYERPALEKLGSVEALTRGGVGVGDDIGFTAFS
jgi:hypothetical protein